MRRRRAVTLTSGLILAFAPALMAAAPSYRIHFPDGRNLEVAEYRIDGTRALLTLAGDGARLELPADRIASIEPIVLEEPPAAEPPSPPASPAPEPAPASLSAAEMPQAAPQAATEETLETIILDSANRHGIEPDLLAAVIAVESGYRSDALSPKGAQGLMQLMPGTARDLSVIDPFDPRQNIDAGARYLRQLIDAHGGSFWKALAAYNAGQGRVARYNGLPPYKETIQYVKRVLDRYQHPTAVPLAPKDRASRPPAGR